MGHIHGSRGRRVMTDEAEGLETFGAAVIIASNSCLRLTERADEVRLSVRQSFQLSSCNPPMMHPQ